MAKLHNYHVLCPLIDQNSFLGVSRDKEKGDVIVTLGRNVVNIYRLSDQKQIGGWSSRDHITSAVIYDKEQGSYAGIFNNNTIKLWKEDTENLDKLKKYKFPVNILKLIPREEKASLIIFSNGNCAALPYALDNRKTYTAKSVIKESETIVSADSYTDDVVDYVCYIIKNDKNAYDIINCPIREELGDLERSKLNRIKVSRSDDVDVIGELICVADKKYLGVFILWSDSKMTVYNLVKKTWKTIATVPWISTAMHVSMAWMGKEHIVLIGSNIDQDAAIMVAYNVFLGVGSCKYPMKIHTEGAKLYCFNSRIILEAPNHIGMLPYVLQTKRNISSLLGSHEIMQEECTEIANWDKGIQIETSVSQEIAEVMKLSVPERTICSQVIMPLLEKSDNTSSILLVLKDFRDVPESLLVKLLSYVIKQIDLGDLHIQDSKKVAWFLNKREAAEDETLKLLNYIFEITFSDALIIPHLKNGLTLNDCLFLHIYISYLFLNSKEPFSSEYESKLLDWYTVLMDSFYQQYLMTKDRKVTMVLQNTRKAVGLLIAKMGIINGTMLEIIKFMRGKTDANDDVLAYTIEMMVI